MEWLKTSIMHIRGVAKGKVGATHQLTEAKQGKFHYTMGPYSDPVLFIKPAIGSSSKLVTRSEAPSRPSRISRRKNW